MDIRAGVIVAAFLAVIAAIVAIRSAIKSMQTARRLSFYSLRKRYNNTAIQLFIFALFLFGLAYWFPTSGERLIYVYFPPSPTPSLTPTITLVPTITLTPTITSTPTLTNTPSVTDTPTATVTPFLPEAIQALFEAPLTPNPESEFTAIQFSTVFDGLNAVDPQTVFELPIEKMYGVFDYNDTIPGVQWTALWYRDGQLVCYETQPWNGGTGGRGGYTECGDPIGGWQPGTYEVQIFMAYEWKVVGRFVVLGDLATSTPTPSPSPSPAITTTP